MNNLVSFGVSSSFEINEIFDFTSLTFYIKRNSGQNDNYLGELIQANQGKEFSAHINRNNISHD